MVPPELLHTTSEGTTEYMIGFLSNDIIGTDKVGKSTRRVIEQLHQQLHHKAKWNSDRSFPRSAARTGMLKNTLVNATERRGNLFLLLCLSHTDEVQSWLWTLLRKKGIDPDQYIEFLKLYLAMEEWFHETNPKEEVVAARVLIAKVIQMMQDVFPRTDGQGWQLPKVHGLTKMQSYICLFGSGINFFGGPGEANHKKFVKDTGYNTQCRIDSFVSQVSTRCYETMLFEIAKEALEKQTDMMYEPYDQVNNITDDQSMIKVEGKYVLTIEGMTDSGSFLSYTCKKKKTSIKVNDRFVEAVSYHAHCSGLSTSELSVDGYTCCKIVCEDGEEHIFRATECYGGVEKWYDWCLANFILPGQTNMKSYPCCLLGLFRYTSGSDTDTVYAVVQSATEPVSSEKLMSEFVSRFEVNEHLDDHTCVIPVECISSPLFVFENSGGSIREYFCVLTRKKWGRYFGGQVVIT